MKIELKQGTVQLWDLGTQSKYEGLRNLYYDGAQGAIFIYDIDNSDTLEDIIPHLKYFSTRKRPCIIIGQKTSKKAKPTSKPVDLEYVKKLSTKYKYTLIQHSEILNRDEIEEIFRKFVDEILSTYSF